MLGSRKVRTHQYHRGLEQSQLKMFNLDCWDPGDSIETHIFGFGKKSSKSLISHQKALGLPHNLQRLGTKTLLSGAYQWVISYM